MLLLPTFNARLLPCPVGPAAFTPHPQGNFCGLCQRVVHDFSQSPDPRADLAAARAAAPDGRVCGTFRREQLVQPAAPKLSRRLRWFVAALVLVVAQGLTAREALAQVRAVPNKPAVHHRKPPTLAKPQPVEDVRVPEEAYYTSGVPLPLGEATVEAPALAADKVYTYAEQMPQLPGGGDIPAVVAFIQQRLRWPEGSGLTDAEGRVYASFTVDENGLVRDAKIVKGLAPRLDAETLRVIRALPIFTPGRQGGRPVKVSFTIPVTFKRN